MANNYFLFSHAISGLEPQEFKWLKATLKREEKMLEKQNEYWGIRCEFYENDAMTIYAEESGNLEALVDVLAAFLLKFRKDSAMIVKWAYTCSKPRPDEFGGGAVLVMAKEQKWIHPENEARVMIMKLGLKEVI